MTDSNSRLDIPYPEKGDKWAPNRAQTISKILNAEKQYVQHLYHFIFEIRVALAEASESKKINIFPDEIENLFRRIAPIYKLNLNFLTLLESSIASDISQSKIGDCFNSTVTLFKAYVEYANDYGPGITALRAQFDSDPNLAPTIKDFESNIGLTILELLRLPVERIPRYRLQLLNLLKVTPREHPDRSGAVAAYIQITPMCDPFIQLLIQKGKEDLEPLDSQFHDIRILGKPHYLMFHDTLKCFTDKGVVDIKIWLFSDSVLVGYQTKPILTPVLYPITNISSTPVDLPSPYDHGVDFMTSIDSYRIVFPNMKRQEYFCEVCENLVIDLNIGENPPLLAPVRTPSNDVKDCMLCGKAFNLALKPIECGFCRKWFCKKCVSVHEINNHKFNVCKECLSKESGKPRPHMLIDYNYCHVFRTEI
ncbi:RhoGEF domain containing protein [Trichomonas vaginalis G3]|uniref:RhoGEF domain containing protein n=1 Tax=Trichomonas vaginalis (strain ATCC PRA-98 / G3) TaxID=412133 RepID=A2DC33_TRIV3|nr:Rho guanyl-nucleotide exchange factor protein [Trichomonas vaginalis G3]EAY22074.1 RhoGEF domain containing protein [Trichomonas vaginalis G3]KAI5525297.1 Rho guanyl-nucleotide exchange factor protein [Trichomonas vaginalis G3]|eukprot:XP_001583060.1 RhoGEF domain containing protein [Trichomonas vaginalis G3]